MSDRILTRRDGDIATVVLNAPQKLNALNTESWRRLEAAIAELSADDELRCVVVRGAGDKAFAAGADITEFVTERSDAGSAKAYGQMVARTMRRSSSPITTTCWACSWSLSSSCG